MSRTACGFVSMDDDEHAKVCLACNRARWQEYRSAHPGPLRRFLSRLLNGVPHDLPLPPSEDSTRG